MNIFSYDANYVDEIVNEFNIISEELLSSVRKILATIDGVTSADGEENSMPDIGSQ